MKNANAWVIGSMIVVSLILGFVAPLDGLEQRSRSDRANGSQSASNGTCIPFVTHGVRYAEAELRFEPAEREISFGF